MSSTPHVPTLRRVPLPSLATDLWLRARAGALSAAWIDAAICVALVAVALSLRLPRLGAVPSFTDETEEVRWALKIARGELLPLVNVSEYIGAWHNYLVALALRLLGNSMLAARVPTLVLGTLTVPLVYGLARELGLSRPVALLGALLLATSGAHVVVASRVSWSSVTTPFYTTLAALLVERTVRRADPRWLVLGGVAAGLGLQTHPTALPLLAGLAAYTAWQGRRGGWLWSRWMLLGVAAFLIAYSPVVIHAASTGFAALIEDVRDHSNEYQRAINGPGTGPLDADTYPDNVGYLLVGLGQLVASSFVPREGALADPGVYLMSGLAIAGLVWSIRGRYWPLPIALLLTVLVLPALNPKYNLVMNARHLMPLLPLAVVTEAAVLGSVLRRGVARLRGGRGSGARWVGAAAVLGAVGLTGWALASPVERLRHYQATVGPYNEAFEALAVEIAAARRPGETVLIDQRSEFSHWKGAPRDFDRARVLRVLLELQGAPVEIIKGETERVRRAVRDVGGEGSLFVTISRDDLKKLSPRLVLSRTPAVESREPVLVFRLKP